MLCKTYVLLNVTSSKWMVCYWMLYKVWHFKLVIWWIQPYRVWVCLWEEKEGWVFKKGLRKACESNTSLFFSPDFFYLLNISAITRPQALYTMQYTRHFIMHFQSILCIKVCQFLYKGLLYKGFQFKSWAETRNSFETFYFQN